jgi:hypothetical protein
MILPPNQSECYLLAADMSNDKPPNTPLKTAKLLLFEPGWQRFAGALS